MFGRSLGNFVFFFGFLSLGNGSEGGESKRVVVAVVVDGRVGVVVGSISGGAVRHGGSRGVDSDRGGVADNGGGVHGDGGVDVGGGVIDGGVTEVVAQRKDGSGSGNGGSGFFGFFFGHHFIVGFTLPVLSPSSITATVSVVTARAISPTFAEEESFGIGIGLRLSHNDGGEKSESYEKQSLHVCVSNVFK